MTVGDGTGAEVGLGTSVEGRSAAICVAVGTDDTAEVGDAPLQPDREKTSSIAQRERRTLTGGRTSFNNTSLRCKIHISHQISKSDLGSTYN